ncbi:MAG: hypothetical protein FWC23_09545 [Chitinispirillia bacterium]|nr:hypothetical protein [Chitinispirillia bacterium]MCL2269412.1 hypothetical protein [Chitinispirillia bacterium]
MGNERPYDDPVDEVYRIREETMEEFGWDLKKYHAYLNAQQPQWEAMGFKFLTEEEYQVKKHETHCLTSR